MSAFGGAVRERKDYQFAVIGVPFDEKSSFLKGVSQGPRAIREASTGDAINPCTELGVDLSRDAVMTDLGDIDTRGSFMEVFSRLEQQVLAVLGKNAVPIVLGGDHSISYASIRAVAREIQPLDILHFDAHPDLYEEYEGDRFSHACPFARILEEGISGSLVQVGIRTATPEHREYARRYGVRMIEMKDYSDDLILEFDNPVFISFDIDALDPAFAPGVSHCEPGGLTTRQVIRLVHSLEADVIGMDMVEVNPVRDSSSITAAAAAKIIMETAGKIIAGRG